jgi:hypothetical protein
MAGCFTAMWRNGGLFYSDVEKWQAVLQRCGEMAGCFTAM